MDWEKAGDAWGWRAAEWASLVERGNFDLFLDVLDQLAVGDGHTYLDIGCGSGLALGDALRRGATVAGLDASRQLIAIAAERFPTADVRAGDMASLPWPDDSFDVVTSFNGVWNVENAFAEARRVLRPGGRFAMSFWGAPANVDFYKLMPALMEHSPPDELSAAAGLLSVGEPGVAEDLLERNGLAPGSRHATVCVQEYPDLQAASRALVASGPTYAAVQHAGEQVVRASLEELLKPLVSPSTGMVRVSNEWSWITAAG